MLFLIEIYYVIPSETTDCHSERSEESEKINLQVNQKL